MKFVTRGSGSAAHPAAGMRTGCAIHPCCCLKSRADRGRSAGCPRGARKPGRPLACCAACCHMRCPWRSQFLTGELRQLGVPGMPAIAACGSSTFNPGVIVTSGHTPGRLVLDLHRLLAPMGVACDTGRPLPDPQGGPAHDHVHSREGFDHCRARRPLDRTITPRCTPPRPLRPRGGTDHRGFPAQLPDLLRAPPEWAAGPPRARRRSPAGRRGGLPG